MIAAGLDRPCHHVHLYYVHLPYTCCSKKQEQDNKKAMERGRRELVKIDQQLKVSSTRLTELREQNHMLSQRLEEEKARNGDEEYKLKVHAMFLAPCYETRMWLRS